MVISTFPNYCHYYFYLVVRRLLTFFYFFVSCKKADMTEEGFGEIR